LPEGILWQVLRQRPGGLKFRRQHPFDRCTVDFYCPAVRLVVEVDGDHHSLGDNPETDRRRDAWLREQGLQIIRLDAADLLRDVESAVTAILRAARR
jgi:very-short-patch-repair endonuclease